MSDMNMGFGKGGSTGGGPPGTASEPWNPAAKLASGSAIRPMSMEDLLKVYQQNKAQAPSTDGAPIPATPAKPPSVGEKIGNLLIPDTMKSLQGKGGARG